MKTKTLRETKTYWSIRTTI